MDIVGLIPAGGKASRMGKLPCSKEVFPLAVNNGKVTVVSSNLLRYYRLAGINQLFFILRKGKWDIPEYFGDGSESGVNIGYLIMNLPFGTPFTLDQAYPFIKEKIIALGFPDILFEPEDAFVQLKSKMLKSDADIVLGVVPCKEYLQSDMVDFDKEGNISQIIIKQNRPDLKFSWFIALWRPSFTEYMHAFLKRFLEANPHGKMPMPDGSVREIYIGDIIQSALSAGMKLEHVLFPLGNYRDMGTPNRLQQIE